MDGYDGHLADEFDRDDDPRTGPGQGGREPGVEVDVTMLAAEVVDLGGKLQEAMAKLDEHDGVLEALIEMVEGSPGGPWHWARLSPRATRALWLQMGEWVQWLEGRYLVNISGDDYDLPACWWRHPVAVELLTALMVSHQSVYSTRKRVASMELVDWHTRAFVPIFGLLTALKVFKNCRTTHTETRPAPARHDPEAFTRFVDEVAPDPDAGDEVDAGDGPA